METIINKEDLCALCPQVDIKSKGRMLAAIATAVSIAIIVVAAIVKEMEDLSTILMTIGVISLVASLAKLIGPGKRLTYRPTGERIFRVSLDHPTQAAESVEEALKKGDYQRVKELATRQSAPLMTVVYGTKSGSFFAGQTLQYIPYEYQPLTKAYLFTK